MGLMMKIPQSGASSQVPDYGMNGRSDARRADVAAVSLTAARSPPRVTREGDPLTVGMTARRYGKGAAIRLR
jgi:hypothetical protein